MERALTATRETAVTETMPARDLVDAWLGGRTPRTIEAYRRDLGDFATSLSLTDPKDAVRLLFSQTAGEANGMVLAYRTDMVTRTLAPATVNRRLAALRSLVKLARTLGVVTWALEIPGVKVERYRDTAGPGRHAVHAALTSLGKCTSAKAARDRAIIRCLYDLALRVSEVTSLDVEDVDGSTLAVLGKGRTQKKALTLPEPTRDAIAAWLAVRGDAPGALFTTASGKRLDRTNVFRMVRRHGLRRPHGIRHSAVTEALALRGGDYRAVSRFSRHRDVRVLQAYDDNREDLAGEVAREIAAGV